MKALNTAAYLGVVVLMTPVQLFLLVLKYILMTLTMLVALAQDLTNIFVVWLMPDNVKKLALEEVARRKAAARQ